MHVHMITMLLYVYKWLTQNTHKRNAKIIVCKNTCTASRPAVLYGYSSMSSSGHSIQSVPVRAIYYQTTVIQSYSHSQKANFLSKDSYEVSGLLVNAIGWRRSAMKAKDAQHFHLPNEQYWNGVTILSTTICFVETTSICTGMWYKALSSCISIDSRLLDPEDKMGNQTDQSNVCIAQCHDVWQIWLASLISCLFTGQSRDLKLTEYIHATLMSPNKSEAAITGPPSLSIT